MKSFKQFIVENRGEHLEAAAAQHGFVKGNVEHSGKDNDVKSVHFTHPVTGHSIKVTHFHQSPRSINRHYAGTDSTFSAHKADGSVHAMGHEVSHLNHVAGQLKEGAEEHEKLKDHTSNPYHKVLTGHGFVHHSTVHKQNPLARSNPRADSTHHYYTHPNHGKSSVEIEQEHDSSVGHGGRKVTGHSFIHRHEQSNGIVSPSHGERPAHLHKSLSSEYGVPKGMKAPELTASEKKFPHTAPKYKMNEEAATDHTKHPFHSTLTNHGFKHTGSRAGSSTPSAYDYGRDFHSYEHPTKGKVNVTHVTIDPKKMHGSAETHWNHAHPNDGFSKKTSSAGRTPKALDAYLSHSDGKSAKIPGVKHLSY